MTTSYNSSSRWQWVWMSTPFILVLLVLTFSAHAQEGSRGNTTIFGGAQMTFFGNHNFLTGGAGTQPGVIGTVRSLPFGVLNFATTASTTTGATDAGHVDGYVRKLGPGQFIFPTGDNAHYGPFAAAADGTTGAYFFVDPTSAVTSNLAGGNYSVLPTGGPFPSATKATSLSAVSTKEYWDIDGANATLITLTWSTSSAIGPLTGNDLSKLTIAGWNGTQWVAIPSTVDVTSVLGGASGLPAGSITSTAAITPDAYTAYTFASTVTLAINPDNNVTYVNVPVGGNVNTNDKVSTGTTYGTPTASTNNPAGGSITVNPDGTYSFTGTTPGSYTYAVPVCSPGQTTNCPTTLLVITVKPNPADPTVPPAPPVANTDIASVKGDPTTPASVSLNVRANDQPTNPGGTLGTPTIISQPTHGTATVGPDGNIVYTPAPGYYGDDVLTYQVCESPSGLCTTAQEIIRVLPPNSPNTTLAGDDYVATAYNTPVTGNASANDTDPEGNAQAVSPQTTTTPAGSLTLSADGSFRFVPTSGYTGPVSFTYATCDDGSPQACANATLYILVAPPVPDLTPIVYARPSTVYNTTQISVVVDVIELLGVPTSGLVTVRISKDAKVSLGFEAGASLINGRSVQNSLWSFDGVSNPSYYLFTTNSVVAPGDKLSLGMTGTLTPGATTGTVTLSAVIIGTSGGEIRVNNNVDADKIDYFQQ